MARDKKPAGTGGKDRDRGSAAGRGDPAKRPNAAGREPPGGDRPVIVLFVVIFVVALAGLWWLLGSRGSRSSLAGKGKGLNVLLITLDTTRADTLGCYGNVLCKTPNIDKLAGEGVRFAQCTATAPITLPSHASIMTSTYPFVHRARNNGRFVADEGNTTLAEILRQNGYATGAEVSAYVLDAVWGLDQGFDSYRSDKKVGGSKNRLELQEGEQSVPATDVCDRAIEWLRNRGKQKFFLWVHFFDPHQPWQPPASFAEPYASESYGRYLGEISFMDDQIGRLLGELRRLKLDERTLVVLTADHGEGLMEHQELTHTYFIYDSTMRVPLILSCPSLIAPGGVVGYQVSTVDIVPTVLSLLGFPAKADAQGESLLRMLEPGAPDPDVGAYAETVAPREAHGYARLRAYRTGTWKYIHAPKPELYNVRTDPRENRNVIGSYPEIAVQLRNRMEGLIAESQSSGAASNRAAQLDAEAAERLAALGYVGGYASPVQTDEMSLIRRFEGPDPKDRIEIASQFLKARGWADADKHEQAVAILRKLVAEEPESAAIRARLAEYLQRIELFAESAMHYEVLLRLQPENALAHYRFGRVLGELNRVDEAEEHLRIAVEAMPEDPRSQKYYAFALAQQGKLDQAEEHFRTVLRLEPDDEGACTELSSLLQHRAQAREALDLLRQCLVDHPDSMTLANNLAWVLATASDAQLRDGDEALRLAKDIQRRAETPDPSILDTLAAAYAESGRFADAAETARQALALTESEEYAELAEEVRARLELYESGQPYRRK